MKLIHPGEAYYVGIGGVKKPYEIGWRADKSGNRYEVRVVIYYLLKILEEKIDYFVLEALGDDEQGIDILIGNNDGSKEGIVALGGQAISEHETSGVDGPRRGGGWRSAGWLKASYQASFKCAQFSWHYPAFYGGLILLKSFSANLKKPL